MKFVNVLKKYGKKIALGTTVATMGVLNIVGTAFATTGTTTAQSATEGINVVMDNTPSILNTMFTTFPINVFLGVSIAGLVFTLFRKAKKAAR